MFCCGLNCCIVLKVFHLWVCFVWLLDIDDDINFFICKATVKVNVDMALGTLWICQLMHSIIIIIYQCSVCGPPKTIERVHLVYLMNCSTAWNDSLSVYTHYDLLAEKYKLIVQSCRVSAVVVLSVGGTFLHPLLQSSRWHCLMSVHLVLQLAEHSWAWNFAADNFLFQTNVVTTTCPNYVVFVPGTCIICP